MFLEIFLFEIKLRLKRISTWVYFGIWFLMAFFSVSVRQFGPGSFGGKVFVNSPYTIMQMMASLSAFGLVVISAIFGTSIVRDFEENTYAMFFTTPIKKRDYLGGRLLGSLAITIFVFSGLIVGLLVGKFMPWADQSRLMPINLWFHLQPFLLFTVIEIIFCGALFFMIGALTRSIMAVYLQGVVFLALYFIALVVTANDPDALNKNWPALLDPLGILTAQKITRYWTVAEKNSTLISFAGVMAWNRLLWLGLGALAVIATFRFFPFSAEALTTRRTKKKLDSEPEDSAMATPQSAFRTVTQQFTTGTTVQQFLRLTRQRVFAVIREFPFIAIVIITIVLFVLNAKDAGRFFNTPVLPVTYLIVGQLSGMFLFFLVIATLYAGELVWKERGLNFDQIYDALPMPGWVTFASQLTALAIVQLLLAILMITFGVITQAVNGYFKFELHIYLKDILGIWLIGMLQYTVLALLIQNLVSNKFLGHTIIILYNLATIVALRYGFENYLYQYSTAPNYTYSDMNGFGHYVKPLVWFSLYWTAGAGILAALAILFTRRGADLSWKSRWQIARERFRFPINVLAIVCLLAFAGIGVFIYHNTHRLNSYRDGEYRRVMQARYERQYKKYEALPQPKITAVEIKADLFPEQRSFQASGSYVLLNQSDEPIQDVHLLDANESFRQLKFDRAAKETLADKEIGYHIYQLAEPLKPKESLKLEFTVGHESKGFRNNGERNEFAFNGTFFDSSYFPVIGYNRQGELSDEDERRDQGLAPQPEMPLPDDPKARRQSLFSQDSRWINFKATVSTAPDQIAVAPGYLQREWIENGRRYFAYDMGETKIQNFYSFVSGKYQVRRDQWQGSNGEAVNIEVYYHPGHEYNIARMIDSTKKGLDYFTKNFGPYQFKQFRILEFPRYRSFAQSFPNTIPYSEGIGFIAHAYDENDLDAPFYVTAHELAHQWWGHQVIGCFAQGSNMLSESLAQYSALMLMEKEVGASNIRTYLKNELDRYLRGRSAERRKEPPMYLVQSEPYVWYQKGSLVMYALKDYLGEEKLNAALKKFLEATKYQEPPYTNSLEFIKFLKDAAPDELKPVIADLFEHITLFDNRAIEATYRETPDKKYIVKIKVEAKKLHADGLGAENEVPINDLVDIGVFVGEKKNQRALFLEKRRLTRAQSEFEITVSELPTRAGIDPYNKLIDRKPDDNTVVVSKSE